MQSFSVLAQKDTAPGWLTFLPFIFIGIFFYMLLIKPQQKQRRQQQQMLTNIKTGDKVITIGGIYGLVTNVRNGILVLKIAEGVKIEIARDAIRAIIDGKETPPSQAMNTLGSPGRR
jgi:preprotein translocase subunit YajC